MKPPDSTCKFAAMARLSGNSSAAASKASGSSTSNEGETTKRTTAAHSSDVDDQSTPDFADWAEAHSPHTSKPLPYDESLLPDGKRSLSGISLQAFVLGTTFAASLMLCLSLIWDGYGIWRFFAFTATLSVFHFLEFWTTATYNPLVARSSSFLLFSNGTAYNLAHTCAVIEILASHYLFPSWQQSLTNPFTISIGLFLVLFGQITRSAAMATAGKSFNHTPQKVKKQDHVLVTSGVYNWSRHPSYFAFFWWALGTQILVGNKICLLAYVVALWRFFKLRIAAEERNLVEFFGKDYEQYRAKTSVGIPFI